MALERFFAALEPFGAALEPIGVALEPFGVALEPFGVALEPFGVALEPFGAALEPSGVVFTLTTNHLLPSFLPSCLLLLTFFLPSFLLLTSFISTHPSFLPYSFTSFLPTTRDKHVSALVPRRRQRLASAHTRKMVEDEDNEAAFCWRCV